jgi:hypothetical protein
MQVESHRLFHVTRSLVYNQNPPLSVDESFTCGDRHNPFFAFYERPRTYSVHTDKGPVNVPAIAFLKHVEAGRIQAHNLAGDAVQIAQHYIMLCRELIMEEIREKHFPHLPSRKTCIWAAEDLDLARFWVQRLGGQNARILELEVSGALHRADASLMVGDSEPLSETYANGYAYWRGERSRNPEMETLFTGTARIVSIVGV